MLKPNIVLFNVYFQTTIAPSNKAVVILNASEKEKVVNNLTVMTNVSTAYAPGESFNFGIL
jgi:hypothetical protein